MALTRARKAVFVGTSASPKNGEASSHLPSRFLEEIQLESTVAVMGAMQRLASGVAAARGDLLASVKRYGGIRKIVNNLVSEYLKDIGYDALTARVSRIAAGKRETPFAYRHAYSSAKIASAVKARRVSSLHRAWKHVQR